MSLPGFTAEASLYETSRHYWLTAGRAQNHHEVRIQSEGFSKLMNFASYSEALLPSFWRWTDRMPSSCTYGFLICENGHRMCIETCPGDSTYCKNLCRSERLVCLSEFGCIKV